MASILSSYHISNLQSKKDKKIKTENLAIINIRDDKKTELENLAIKSINNAIKVINSIRFKNGVYLVDQNNKIPDFKKELNNINEIRERAEEIKDEFFKRIILSSFGYLFLNESKINLDSLATLTQELNDSNKLTSEKKNITITLNYILNNVLSDICINNAILTKYFNIDGLSNALKSEKRKKIDKLEPLYEKIKSLEFTTADTSNTRVLNYMANFIKIVLNEYINGDRGSDRNGDRGSDRNGECIKLTSIQGNDIDYLYEFVTFIKYIYFTASKDCDISFVNNETVNDATTLFNLIERINEKCVYPHEDYYLYEDQVQGQGQVQVQVQVKNQQPLVFKSRHIRIILLYYDKDGSKLINQGLKVLKEYEENNGINNEKFRNSLFNYIAFDTDIPKDLLFNSSNNMLELKELEKLKDLKKLNSEKPEQGGGKIVRKYLPGVYKCNDNRTRRVFLIKGHGNTQFVSTNNQIVKKRDLIKKKNKVI